MIEQTVEELTPLVGTRPACRALGAAAATIYRRRRPPTPRPRRPRPLPARALSETERQTVLDLLHSERFVDSSPAQVWATLLDEGRYLASQRTMYRLLAAEHGGVRERRDQLTHPPYARPELLAERPNEVWSWDISKLKGPAKWTCFHLYVVLDVFSRYTVAWTVAQRAKAQSGLLRSTRGQCRRTPSPIAAGADTQVDGRDRADEAGDDLAQAVAVLDVRDHGQAGRWNEEDLTGRVCVPPSCVTVRLVVFCSPIFLTRHSRATVRHSPRRS